MLVVAAYENRAVIGRSVKLRQSVAVGRRVRVVDVMQDVAIGTKSGVNRSILEESGDDQIGIVARRVVFDRDSGQQNPAVRLDQDSSEIGFGSRIDVERNGQRARCSE